MKEQVYTGSRVTADVAFSVDGVMVDPDQITARTMNPVGVGTSTTWPTTALARLDVGKYRFEFKADVAGVWWVRFDGTGAVVFSAEMAVVVTATNSPQRLPIVWPVGAAMVAGSQLRGQTPTVRAGAAALVSHSSFGGSGAVSSFGPDIYYDIYRDTY